MLRADDDLKLEFTYVSTILKIIKGVGWEK